MIWLGIVIGYGVLMLLVLGRVKEETNYRSAEYFLKHQKKD